MLTSGPWEFLLISFQTFSFLSKLKILKKKTVSKKLFKKLLSTDNGKTQKLAHN